MAILIDNLGAYFQSYSSCDFLCGGLNGSPLKGYVYFLTPRTCLYYIIVKDWILFYSEICD